MGFIKVLLYGVIILAITGGCIKESDKRIKSNLLVILQDDLNSIISDVPKDNIIDSVFYEIVLYKYFKKESFKYSKKAIVDFYFLKKVKVKIVRKYRYLRQSRKWERYYNEYKFYGIAEKK